MKIIKDLWWFFRLEKKRYIIGILALILVAILNLVPPKVMGGVIDRVTSGELTQGQLLMSLFLFRLCVFAYLIILQKCHLVFIKNIVRVI